MYRGSGRPDIKSCTHEYDNKNELFEAQIDITVASCCKISTQKVFSCLITLRLRRTTGDIKEKKTKCGYYRLFQSETPVFGRNFAGTSLNRPSVYIHQSVNRFLNRLFVISVNAPKWFS